jgi:hypothetical protein
VLEDAHRARRGKHDATPRRPITSSCSQVQRVPGLFLFLPVTGEMDELVLVAGRELTRDRQLTAG